MHHTEQWPRQEAHRLPDPCHRVSGARAIPATSWSPVVIAGCMRDASIPALLENDDCYVFGAVPRELQDRGGGADLRYQHE